MPILSRSSTKLAALALLVLGLWPWVGELGILPVAADSHFWIARGASFEPDWAEWVFATPHFRIGYKPVTAFSYTLNELAFGLAPWVYRVTDLLVFAFAACGVFALSRALRARTQGAVAWTALVAMAIFLAHPGVEEVVPYISRRGYSLATALGIWGLVLALPRAGEERVPWSRSLAAGALLAGGMLAYEPAILSIAILPVLLYATIGPRPERFTVLFRACAGTVLFVGAGLAARFAVVGGIGGYAVEAESRAISVLLSAWRALPVVGGNVGTVLVTVTIAYYLIRSLTGPGWGTRLSLWLWLVSYPLLFATQGVWFPRLVFFMLPPFALLFADVLGDTFVRFRARPFPMGLHLAPQVALLAAIVWASPVLRGPDAERVEMWRSRDAHMRTMVTDLAACSDPARVLLVQEYWPTPERSGVIRSKASRSKLGRLAWVPSTWAGTVLREQDLELMPFIFFEGERDGRSPSVSFDDEGTPGVRIPAGVRYAVRRPQGVEWIDAETERTEPLPVIPGEQPNYVYVYGDGAGGELVALPGE
jgi:hypothetical protein